MTMTEDERYKGMVALHESFHCVCSYFLGRRVVKVTIEPDRPLYEALPRKMLNEKIKILDDHIKKVEDVLRLDNG